MITCKASNLSFSSFSLQPSCRPNPRTLGFLPAQPPLRSKCRVFSSVDRRKRNPRSNSTKSNRRREDDGDVDDEEEEDVSGKVHCEVDVISWRERRIKATILVNADVESLWNALTDYERLAEFVPNLTCSGRPHYSHLLTVKPKW